MKRKQFFVEVARLADTSGTGISAAETSRVLKLALDKLAELSLSEVAELLRAKR